MSSALSKKRGFLILGIGVATAVAAGMVLKEYHKRSKRRKLLKMVGIDDEHEAKIGLAVDVGSSSIRCSAYLLGPKNVTYISGSMNQIKRDALKTDGTADAEQVLAHMEVVIDKCIRFLRGQGLAHCLAVVGFAAFVMNLVGVDESGIAVTPVLTYADRHPHASLYVEKLRQKAKAKNKLHTIYEATGAPIHTAYAPAQLWRLAEEDPETIKKVDKWQTLTSLAIARWTGTNHLPICYSEASWTGMLDFKNLRWYSELLSLLPINQSSLPALVDYHEGPSGESLIDRYASRWPELKVARFYLGIGDGACANIGSGCRDPTRLAVTIGTSAATRIVVDGSPEAAQSVRVPYGLWCYRIDRSRLLLGGALTDGGSLVRFMGDTFGMNSVVSERQASLLGPDGHGLTILPFLSGERAPGWNPDAKAMLGGLTKNTTKAEIYRAGLESIALRLGSIVNLMAGALPAGAVVGASGTALEVSSLWRQILADVLGLDVILVDASEATSLGVAVLMAEGLYHTRLAADYDEACRHTPHPEAYAIYQRAIQRQESLYEALYKQK